MLWIVFVLVVVVAVVVWTCWICLSLAMWWLKIVGCADCSFGEGAIKSEGLFFLGGYLIWKVDCIKGG